MEVSVLYLMLGELGFKWVVLEVIGEKPVVLLLLTGDTLIGVEFCLLAKFVEEVAGSLLERSCSGRVDLLQRWLLSWKQLLWNFFLQEEQFSGIDLPPKRLAQ